jgi:hypothetical protein
MADSYGLNKAARLRAEHEERLAEDAPAPLDPEFPYTVIRFDPAFYGAAKEHDPPPDAL